MMWRPLQPAIPIRNPKHEDAIIRHARTVAERDGKPFNEARLRAVMEEEARVTTIWKNLDYQVAVKKWEHDGIPLFHLSIKRVDRKPVRDWRDLKRIKNQLVGEEVEAVEIFPAESRLIDTANQYHLWGVLDPKVRVPFGWHDERIVDYEPGDNTGVVQRGEPVTI